MFSSEIAEAIAPKIFEVYPPSPLGWRIGSEMMLRLGVSLAKGHTRTDWTRRPLSADQLEYAADDVRYLAQLYANLRSALEQEGKLGYILLWALGVPIPVLFVIFLLRGCT